MALVNRVEDLEKWRGKHEENDELVKGRVIVLEEHAKNTDRSLEHHDEQIQGHSKALVDTNKCITDQQKLMYEQWSKFQWWLIGILATSAASFAAIIITR